MLGMCFNYGDKKATEGIYKEQKLSYIKTNDMPELIRLSIECKDPEIREAANILILGLQIIGNHIKYSVDLEEAMHKRAVAIISTYSDEDLKNKGVTREKAIKDAEQQLISQYCLRELLSPIYKTLSFPDVSVYESGNKDFRDEFVDRTTGQKLCVKSQDVERIPNYRVSWIYNVYEYLFTKEPSRYHKLTKVCFMQIDRGARTAVILTILNAETPHKYSLFKEPIKLEYYKIKRAIYFKDIEAKGIDKCEL